MLLEDPISLLPEVKFLLQMRIGAERMASTTRVIPIKLVLFYCQSVGLSYRKPESTGVETPYLFGPTITGTEMLTPQSDFSIEIPAPRTRIQYGR